SQKKKYDRVKTLDDDEDDDEKDLIADEIFYPDGEGELEEGEAVDEPLQQPDDDEEGEDEESDIDDFIVDDDGQPITKKRGKKFSGYTDAALQEAQEIFGGDFDFADFDADAYDQGEEEEEDQDEEGWDRPKKQTKRRLGRKSIFEIYEPSELESSHMTDQDNEIRSTDMPERFQLRAIPVKPAEDDELEEEAEWIFRHGFSTLTISMQESTDYLDRGTTTNFSRKGPSTIAKIKEALNFMRNQQFEVPFIAFYRKEYVEPELNINDLWKVWQWDEKWTQLKTRKQNLTRLFQKMQSYQFEQISADPDKPLADGIRPLDTTDMERLKDVQTLEELSDVYNHFLLYYGRDIPKMQNAAKANKKRLKKIKEVSEDGKFCGLKKKKSSQRNFLASRRDMYSICQSVGLDGLAKKFGLTPEQFGENLRDSYQRHETEQFPAEPVELAKDYVCSQFSTPETVLEGTRYMVAMQIAREPLVRHVLRQTFQERAKVNIKPTKKGKKEVDEAHFAYSFKYLKNKPVKELNGDQFLKMCLAEDEGLLTIDICIDLIGVKGYAGDQTYFDEIKQFYYRDEFSHQVQEWNRQRTLAIERALNQFLYPQMAKELKSKLIAEAKESIIRSCCRRLYNWLKVAPYRPDQQVEEDDDLMDENQGKGIRVLGVAYAPSRDTPVFCALINGEGEVMDFLRLPYFMKRRNAFREDEREKKASDIENLKRFLSGKKPHVVAVAGENRDAQMIMEDIKRTIGECLDYPPLLRQAVSIARKIQDPLVEYAQVCSTDEDILCLKLHPLQVKIQNAFTVADGIYQHVDVREEGKENAFSLGHTLWINNEEFEDLDEITARYIQPMASFARDLLGHKYFQECNGGNREKMEELLIRTKREKPTFIPYFISACKDLPGKFILGYQPRGKPRIEYVTITPDGFRYRSQIFPTVNGLFRWFKDHYQEPVPGITPSNSSRTRTPASLNATPANINIADLTRAVNALPRNMTSQMFNAIAAVTGQGQNPNTTPAQWGSSQYGYGGSTGGGGSSSAYHVFATPQQPMATPMMTPSYSYTTPSQQALGTPQYPGSTPQSSHSHAHAHPHGSHIGSNSSAVDWGKMAEQWLKEKEAEGRKKAQRMTPRPSPSPMIESTPMSIAGDATPLLDEMDR
uniref:Transcription elongation factor spt6 n=1 Tax=Oreochromis aureus TaxID=47969 RepID=A0A668VNX6_OREAU